MKNRFVDEKPADKYILFANIVYRIKIMLVVSR